MSIMVYFFKKGDIIMSKTLATKLHDNLCPMCNGRCHCGSVCIFEHEPKDETVWDNNIANSYFLELAKKAVNIISETGITEEGEVIGEFVLNKATLKTYDRLKSRGITNLKDIFE